MAIFIAGASFYSAGSADHWWVHPLCGIRYRCPGESCCTVSTGGVLVAVILSAVIKLGGKALKTATGILGGCPNSTVLGLSEILAILGAGLLGTCTGCCAWAMPKIFIPCHCCSFRRLPALLPASLGKLFLTFLR